MLKKFKEEIINMGKENKPHKPLAYYASLANVAFNYIKENNDLT